ncbi:MAG: hypothetical protein IKI55_01090, partial [Bacilli bacterium]|nr:hypothetical protein [Bacilli bacterium]
EYPIQGYTYLPSGSSFNYIQVDFGLVDVNGTNLYRSLTFGSGTPQIIASYTPSAPVVGQPVTISFSGSDSASNLILACGETTAVGKHDRKK